MINQNSKPNQRKELLRQYATIIFTKGTIFEQLEFLDSYTENRLKHWNWQNINDIVSANDPLNIIEQSIQNIKQLNKKIY
jgi:hypothetical protein